MISIGTIISTHRKKKQFSQLALAEELNRQFGYAVSNKSVSKWEKDLASPDIHVFFALCRILEITDLYGAYFGSNPADPLSVLNELGKEKAYEYAELLANDERYRKESLFCTDASGLTAGQASVPAASLTAAQTNNRFTASDSQKIVPFRTIPLQLYPVSAGPGNFLDSENYEDMQVGNDVPMSADFAVRVSGDSMEPMLHKNQIIYVHRQETLESGEYGIFFLNGEAYVKRFQKDETGTFLLSLNTAYAPIPVDATSDFRIFGKLVF